MNTTSNLAIFDLDNTLLAGDSDHLWGEFLVERGRVNAEWYASENQRYYEAYTEGTLDIDAFLRFSLKPLHDNDLHALSQWREEFVAEKIRPIITGAARELIQHHKTLGDELLIITATNRFVTEPIAALLGIPNLLATEPEMVDGRYTGQVSGIPCFREGKVTRLAEWLEQRGTSYARRWFYSDSHNDLPLLEQVERPIAVDPDTVLREQAMARGWPIVSLRTGNAEAVLALASR